jgi:hypothetical protein
MTGAACRIDSLPGRPVRKQLAPFARALAERMRYGNKPIYAVVTIGQGCWQRAKDLNGSKADTVCMVAPPDADPTALEWPVKGIPVVIYSDTGPSTAQVHALALTLLKAGAVNVLQIDLATPAETFDRYTQYRWRTV